MSKFHATYVALAFALLLLTLNVDVLAGHRTLFAVINLSVLGYLCFFNAWFRNKLLGWIIKATKMEK